MVESNGSFSRSVTCAHRPASLVRVIRRIFSLCGGLTESDPRAWRDLLRRCSEVSEMLDVQPDRVVVFFAVNYEAQPGFVPPCPRRLRRYTTG